MQRILVVDDESDILDLISYNLRKEGFEVDTSSDGRAAFEKVRTGGYALIVLDLMLPGIHGIEFCRMVRSDRSLSDLPILMLTAKGEEVDKIVGLEVGADDYMTKPFSPRELTARVKAILRRSFSLLAPPKGDSEQGGVLAIGDLIINREEYSLVIAGKPVRLSATEFKLLLYLAERPRKIFSREHLLDTVWGTDVYVEPRTVDVHVRRLRAKIEEDPNNPVHIKTMRGVGYFFEG
ncbi:MAG TPA: response regulator transcription factor [Dissulfurispiraceae bacterium]|nr:response regulator transcription factor [Dissulfurispiraceae bacterium]